MIAFGGLIGTLLLAYALLGAQFMFPRWKRWALGAVGLSLAALLWVAHPNLSGSEADGSSLADDWW